MSSPAKICMNGLCGVTTTSQWKRGWPMKVGGFAILCYACGTAYDNVRYCERFHLNEAGWRECNSCDKPIHCGCVVSKYLHECLDSGGILCIKCVRAKATQPLQQSINNEIPNGFARFSATWHPSLFDNGKLTQSTEGFDKHQYTSFTSTISLQLRQGEKTPSSNKDVGSSFLQSLTLPSEKTPSCGKDVVSSFLKPLTLPSIFPTELPKATVPDNNKPNFGLKSTYDPLVQQPSGFALSSSILSTSNGVAVQEKVALVKQEQKPRLKPSKSGVSVRSQPNKRMCSDNLVARPPAEGRGRGQLLPRYWPKITDQELLKISGDLNSNCTVVPLFEKILSASDAGRIGRLVLPKACAEAYFPPIDQSEGLPIRIRDIKGKEWTFQFRFWPNNNSRMYVLEGVTPCIQNMQLQAGDTVIFSRLDPGDKLIIGCRKAPIFADASALPSTVNDGALTSTGNGNSPTNMEQEGMTNWDSEHRPVIHEKKKSRNIGSKSKRLHMHREDAMELKFTWEEMQEFLRPPPSSKPTVVMIENCELEEYDAPPVFGKKTIFTTNASRLQEQWVQCDSCSKWRKLPSDVLIPSKWTCSDNVSDPNMCSCSAPEERGVGDLNRILKSGKATNPNLLTLYMTKLNRLYCVLRALDRDKNALFVQPKRWKDTPPSKRPKCPLDPHHQKQPLKACCVPLSKKRKVAKNSGTQEPQLESTGLDALASIAVLGANSNDASESLASPTTRHPRHRPGCSCIVCIQPPSGKGNHKPNCICNVCSTVRRRFKTLMLRKQKRLLEQESNSAQKSAIPAITKAESGDVVGIRTGFEAVNESSNKGQELDLNIDPKEEEMMLALTASASDMPPRWHDMLAKLVPHGTTEIKDGPMMTTNKVIEGS